MVESRSCVIALEAKVSSIAIIEQPITPAWLPSAEVAMERLPVDNDSDRL